MGFSIAAYQQTISQRHSPNAKRLRMQDAMALQAEEGCDLLWQERTRELSAMQVAGASIWASVADGVSSSPCADLASLSFLKVLHTADKAAWAKELPESLPRRVRMAVQDWQFQYRNECTEGASTTLASLQIVNDQVCAVNCGDSRIWRLRSLPNGETAWQQLSQDHTMWQQILQDEDQPEEAYGAEHASIYDCLLHCLTLGESADADGLQDLGYSQDWLHVWRGKAAVGDVYLLATDGLHGTVGDGAHLQGHWHSNASLDENMACFEAGLHQSRACR